MREHVFTIHSYNTYSLCILSTRLHAICQGHNPVSMELTINQRRQAFNQNSYTLSIVIIEVQGVLPPPFFLASIHEHTSRNKERFGERKWSLSRGPRIRNRMAEEEVSGETNSVSPSPAVRKNLVPPRNWGAIQMPGITGHRGSEDWGDQREGFTAWGPHQLCWGVGTSLNVPIMVMDYWICIFEGPFLLLSLKSLTDMLPTDLAFPFVFCGCPIYFSGISTMDNSTKNIFYFIFTCCLFQKRIWGIVQIIYLQEYFISRTHWFIKPQDWQWKESFTYP